MEPTWIERDHWHLDEEELCPAVLRQQAFFLANLPIRWVSDFQLSYGVVHYSSLTAHLYFISFFLLRESYSIAPVGFPVSLLREKMSWELLPLYIAYIVPILSSLVNVHEWIQYLRGGTWWPGSFIVDILAPHWIH